VRYPILTNICFRCKKDEGENSARKAFSHIQDRPDSEENARDLRVAAGHQRDARRFAPLPARTGSKTVESVKALSPAIG
jgi:hypothetical protein